MFEYIRVCLNYLLALFVVFYFLRHYSIVSHYYISLLQTCVCCSKLLSKAVILVSSCYKLCSLLCCYRILLWPAPYNNDPINIVLLVYYLCELYWLFLTISESLLLFFSFSDTKYYFLIALY